MTLVRLAFVAFVAFGLASAGLAACSSLDPTPPNPHFVDDPPDQIDPARLDVRDSGQDASGDAP